MQEVTSINKEEPKVDFFDFRLPIREIKTVADVDTFKLSESYQDLMRFIQYINHLLNNEKISEYKEIDLPKSVSDVIDGLDQLLKLIDETPCHPGGQRFGNLAFRDWHAKLDQLVNPLLKNLLPSNLHNPLIEIIPYFLGSFGNSSRIDYGSGHELAFIIFLMCLSKLGFFEQQDMKLLGLVIFPKYLDLVRKLQITYKLEPAGSHGVWGLDDFQFVPYIWGSSQLLDNKELSPKSIQRPEIASSKKEESLLFGCVDYIFRVKQGPFHEHSPILFDISRVPYWQKVNNGLIRMYQDEVLSKFPIVQHLLFGSMFSFKAAP